MFGRFKRQPRKLTDEEYQAEYRRLLLSLDEVFSIGDSPYNLLLHSMAAIEHEMNHNGGCNWSEADYVEFLAPLREHLNEASGFRAEQLSKIRWSFDEIITCARELDELGESGRDATEAVNYLIFRVVDWCRLYPRPGDNS